MENGTGLSDCPVSEEEVKAVTLKRKTPTPRKPRLTTADKVMSEVTERINTVLNAVIDEAKTALLNEVTSEAKVRLDRILEYATEVREEGTRRLRSMQADFEGALTKCQEKFNETLGVKLRELEITHNKYKAHFDAAAEQTKRFQDTLNEYKRQNAELLTTIKELRDEFTAYKATIETAKADATTAKNLAVDFKAELVSVGNRLDDLRRFVNTIAEKVGMRHH